MVPRRPIRDRSLLTDLTGLIVLLLVRLYLGLLYGIGANMEYSCVPAICEEWRYGS